MSEFNSGEPERCQNPSYLLENNIVTNLIRHITVKTGPLGW